LGGGQFPPPSPLPQVFMRMKNIENEYCEEKGRTFCAQYRVRKFYRCWMYLNKDLRMRQDCYAVHRVFRFHSVNLSNPVIEARFETQSQNLHLTACHQTPVDFSASFAIRIPLDIEQISNISIIFHYKKMRCSGHVTHVGESRGAYRVLMGKLRERNHLEDVGVDGRIILTL